MKIKIFLLALILAVTILFCGGGVRAADNSAIIAQLQAQIANLLAQIQTLRAQQTGGSSWCHTFNNNLGYANSGSSEVSELHKALIFEGFTYGSDGETTYADGTVGAVIKFQAKYGIRQTGYVGYLTRTKLNAIYGCNVNTNVNANVNTNYQQIACTPSWQCNSWDTCYNSQQTRYCYDANNCGVTTGKPYTTQACTVACTPSWQCNSWDTCYNSQQTRYCYDTNNCGVTTNKPATTQSCASSTGNTNNTGSTAVNGVCGSTNGTSLSSTPYTNLCSAGTASYVSGSGPWSWTCTGLNGGSTASCSATLASQQTTTTIPSAPRSLTAYVGTGNYAGIGWTAPLSNGGSTITGYKVYRGTTSGGETLVTTGGCSNLANVPGCMDLNLNYGTTYYYKVSAVNSVGESPLSNEVSYTTYYSMPSAPQSLTATVSNGQIVLNWAAPSDIGAPAVTNYVVHRSTTPDMAEDKMYDVGNSLTFTNSGLTEGTTYYYKVSAYNVTYGHGPLSNQVSARPATPTSVPSAIQDLVMRKNASSLEITWTASTSAVTSYKVYRGTASGAETLLTTFENSNYFGSGNTTFESYGLNTVTYQDSALVSGNTYYYKVSAVNSVGQSSLSNEVSAEWNVQ